MEFNEILMLLVAGLTGMLVDDSCGQTMSTCCPTEVYRKVPKSSPSTALTESHRLV